MRSSTVAGGTGEMKRIPCVRPISQPGVASSAVVSRGEAAVGDVCLRAGNRDSNSIAIGAGGPAFLGEASEEVVEEDIPRKY